MCQRNWKLYHARLLPGYRALLGLLRGIERQPLQSSGGHLFESTGNTLAFPGLFTVETLVSLGSIGLHRSFGVYEKHYLMLQQLGSSEECSISEGWGWAGNRILSWCLSERILREQNPALDFAGHVRRATADSLLVMTIKVGCNNTCIRNYTNWLQTKSHSYAPFIDKETESSENLSQVAQWENDGPRMLVMLVCKSVWVFGCILLVLKCAPYLGFSFLYNTLTKTNSRRSFHQSGQEIWTGT